jgi:hypothetical protein
MRRSPKRTRAAREKLIRIAVVTDLHAYCDIRPDEAPSHYRIDDTNRATNPMLALEELIAEQRNELRADALCCLGDIANQAVPKAIISSWRQLHELARWLGTKRVICTTGNHDIDSRHAYNDYDAKGHLQTLKPPYPLGKEQLNDRYWSRHFVIMQLPNCRLLVLNSCAFHGEGRVVDGKYIPDYEQGRISSHTLNAIKHDLGSVAAPPVNLLLCHHNPLTQPGVSKTEDDTMRGGSDLISALGNGRFGRWLVLHGHQHAAALEYARGGSSAPVVLSAASLCATPAPLAPANVRNQFYSIEFPLDVQQRLGFVGRFRTWTWATPDGWKPAQPGSGLPPSGGFGCALTPGLAKKVQSLLPRRRKVTWEELVHKADELEFLLPLDLQELVRVLSKDGVHTEPKDAAPPTVLWRP